VVFLQTFDARSSWWLRRYPAASRTSTLGGHTETLSKLLRTIVRRTPECSELVVPWVRCSVACLASDHEGRVYRAPQCTLAYSDGSCCHRMEPQNRLGRAILMNFAF